MVLSFSRFQLYSTTQPPIGHFSLLEATFQDPMEMCMDSFKQLSTCWRPLNALADLSRHTHRLRLTLQVVLPAEIYQCIVALSVTATAEILGHIDM